MSTIDRLCMFRLDVFNNSDNVCTCSHASSRKHALEIVNKLLKRSENYVFGLFMLMC